MAPKLSLRLGKVSPSPHGIYIKLHKVAPRPILNMPQMAPRLNLDLGHEATKY